MITLDKISFSQALDLCLENTSETIIKKQVFIYDALKEFIAEDVKAERNSPAFTNSAMDGFAFKHSDNRKLKVVKTIYAGDKYEDFDIKENECVRIMTGARVPEGLDTVIPIEKCISVTDNEIEIPEIKKGSNVRLKGEEFAKGDVLIQKGTEITPEIIAMLVNQGIVNVNIYVKPKIAILSTGNELKDPWESADEDEVYNINSHAIKMLLQKHGFKADIIGIIPDTLDKTVEFIKTLKTKYDVIITSGGISFGDADFLYEAYLKNGLKPLFHGIMVKPGRPTMAGIMDNVFVFALPGNPLSSYINAFGLVIPTLRKLSGADAYYHNIVLAENLKDFKVNPKKDHTILGKYENGKWEAYNGYKYGSGMLSPLINSNSLMILNKGKEIIKKGETVRIVPFECSFGKKCFTFNT
ncbi:molybdopterin molybdenumtransferase MoeA [Nautilia sp. PV-1]|uniref:molybdopterin molybdotransferase MoeA n=1 Tax=Nautilia sp. PV-1 TaxID=2579250 RepID=UPI000FD93ABA|nr:molybdopterin molybdotransferase MoeA [Nautilia sp. PV-1]AZV46992.1 molybdopterin molybdenumtransferase MoeA [Nautilia sp. PV-1]